MLGLDINLKNNSYIIIYLNRSMVTCYNCDTEINDENCSIEHIILNACGGRLKSKGLLCKNCNSIFGQTIDSAFISHFQFLIDYLLIEKERGTPRPIKFSSNRGEETLLFPNNTLKMDKPSVNVTEKGAGKEYSIIAPDEKSMKKILKGIKDKHGDKNPNIDFDQLLTDAKRISTVFDEKIKIQNEICNHAIFKLVTKTAINYFIYVGGIRQYITHLLPYLNSSTEEFDVVRLVAPFETSSQSVHHIISLVGDPDRQILYANVEFFSSFNYLVNLNDKYDGKPINEIYLFDLWDPASSENVELIDISREQFLDLFSNELFSEFSKHLDRFREQYSKILTRGRDHRIICTALDNTLKQYPDETEFFTQDMINYFINEITKGTAPYVNLNDI